MTRTLLVVLVMLLPLIAIGEEPSASLLSMVAGAAGAADGETPEGVLPADVPPLRPFDSEVIRVVDGDTIWVERDGEEIEVDLARIDCPEKGQPFSTAARKQTAALCFNKEVQVYEVPRDLSEVDEGLSADERVMWAIVAVEDVIVNNDLVRVGLAWHDVENSADDTLAGLEAEARSQKLGLWADERAIPPWQWRELTARERSRLMAGAPVRTTEPPATSSAAGEGRPIGYWLNTSSNVRHNSSCEWFQNTRQGRESSHNEGYACGLCGG